MMATTHALAGAAVAVAATLLAPELTPVAVAAALAGGVFPDLDLSASHRRTLHFPVYFWVPAAGAGAVALLAPGPATVAAAAFLLAAALHSSMDVLGGGLELRPWLATSDRAVYDHYAGRWHRPRRLVRYDGAPEDVLLAGLFALPVLAAVDGPLTTVVLGAVGVSAAYALVRKRLPRLATTCARCTPDAVAERLRDRFIER
jgi:hypothetical protein